MLKKVVHHVCLLTKKYNLVNMNLLKFHYILKIEVLTTYGLTHGKIDV